ncbi:FkbM family methyltransferase [Mucilaginibacter ginsenosidivorax]|uniref:FkbM family methyltransferase n=1 Tax=Mucilaginibacter ginsenosidivorax TaxID=862126 RepID=A0A5B8W243_9SPHI|nr:FkbM family methyltransferase [Mucilaginibacter ginsenosidivorax]QEC77924.1 FkbM family methyltransferase [Mucilaginibacter ginsenosidivorax]
MEIKEQLKKVKKKVTELFKVDNNALSVKDQRLLEKQGRFQPVDVAFHGKTIKIVDAVTFLGSYDEIFVHGIYKFEPPQKEITIIDCGANIGLATIYFAINYPTAKIVAFEPDPDIFNVLKQNAATFGNGSIICHNEALSNQDAMLTFWLEGGHSGMLVHEADDRKTAQVKATRLKSFLGTYESITFLKIDIEGEEINVIPDIADELKKVDYLFLEYHSFIDKPQDLELLLSYITAAGMRYYIKEGSHKLYPFISREIFLGMDMLINIFCYRSQPVDTLTS